MKKKYLTLSEARIKVDDVISEEIHFQSKTHLQIFERILSKIVMKRVYEKIWIDGYIYARMKELDKEVSFYYLFDGIPILAKDMTSEQLHIAGEKPAAFLWNKTKKNYTEWKTSKEI